MCSAEGVGAGLPDESAACWQAQEYSCAATRDDPKQVRDGTRPGARGEEKESGERRRGSERGSEERIVIIKEYRGRQHDLNRTEI